MKVQPVDKGEVAEVAVLNAEEVFIVKFVITFGEVTAESRVLVLNHALNANVLDDVDKVKGDVGRDVLSPVSWSVECVADFVSHQHVIHVLAGSAEDWKRKDACVSIEASSLSSWRVLNHNVLSCQAFSQHSFGFQKTHKWFRFVRMSLLCLETRRPASGVVPVPQVAHP